MTGQKRQEGCRNYYDANNEQPAAGVWVCVCVCVARDSVCLLFMCVCVSVCECSFCVRYLDSRLRGTAASAGNGIF